MGQGRIVCITLQNTEHPVGGMKKFNRMPEIDAELQITEEIRPDCVAISPNLGDYTPWVR